MCNDFSTSLAGYPREETTSCAKHTAFLLAQARCIAVRDGISRQICSRDHFCVKLKSNDSIHVSCPSRIHAPSRSFFPRLPPLASTPTDGVESPDLKQAIEIGSSSRADKTSSSAATTDIPTGERRRTSTPRSRCTALGFPKMGTSKKRSPS